MKPDPEWQSIVVGGGLAINGFAVADGIKMQPDVDPASFLNCIFVGGNSNGQVAGL